MPGQPEIKSSLWQPASQRRYVIVLADFGVAFVIIVGLALFTALIVRGQRRRNHPPLTTDEKTAQLEKELADVNKTIEDIDKKWDT